MGKTAVSIRGYTGGRFQFRLLFAFEKSSKWDMAHILRLEPGIDNEVNPCNRPEETPYRNVQRVFNSFAEGARAAIGARAGIDRAFLQPDNFPCVALRAA